MFKNLTIMGRLGMGFGLMLVLLIASAAAGVLGQNIMFSTAGRTITNDVQLAQRASKLEVMLLNERRYEKDAFINLANSEIRASYKTKWDTVRDALLGELAQTRSLELIADDSQKLDAIGAGFKAYGDGFGQVFGRIVAGQIKTTQEANDEFSAFKPAVHRMEDASQALNKAALARVNDATAALSATRRDSSMLQIGIAILCLLVGALACVILTRSITRPLRRAIEIARHVAQGKLDNNIDASGHDEISQVLAALDAMQRSLKERTEAESKTATENGRIRTALDRVSSGAMLADPDGKIIYLNDAVRTIFGNQAGEIRKQLPQFDVERILGSSFDAFHNVPSHQQNMLAKLKSMHQAEVKLGGAVFRMVANPVLAADGRRLGTVVEWFDRTQEVSAEEEVHAIVARAIDGNLSSRIRAQDKTGFFKTLAEGMNRLLDNMTEVVRTMTATAAEVRSGAEEISRCNVDLSQRTEEQASSLQETASSMEEMTSTVKNNADNAAQANQLAAAARAQAERGCAVVGAAVIAMGKINTSSKRIADIIGVIDEIAFQTNLLALNAAVEAARAGEQGRGFAVVASEVRNLASRSAEAAKEIKSLIQDSVGKVAEGTKLVDESGVALGEIAIGVKKVTDVMAEIASSSREQASGIEQVNKAITMMDDVTQQNAALVEEASSAAHALNEQAESLMQLMARYDIADVPATVPAPSRPARAASARSAGAGASVSERRTIGAGNGGLKLRAHAAT
jgi:methyl-accepting chemotaxis protein